MTTTTFCSQCGSSLNPTTNTCPKCSHEASPKSAIVTLLLCIFLGTLGIHRFYVGKIWTGLLMLITAGGFGIWVLVDIILIASCNFYDSHGLPLVFTKLKGSPLKLVFAVLGSVLAAIALYVVLLVLFVLSLTSGMTDTIHNQLIALRAGDYNKAYYSYTSKDFQSGTSYNDFKNFVQHYAALKDNESSSFTDREMQGDSGTVKGTLKAADGTKSIVEYHLVKEGSSWKIYDFTIKPYAENETSTNTPPPTAPAAKDESDQGSSGNPASSGDTSGNSSGTTDNTPNNS